MGCRNIPVKRAVRKRLYLVVGQRVDDDDFEVDPDMDLDEVDPDMVLDEVDPDMDLGEADEVDPDMDPDALLNQS